MVICVGPTIHLNHLSLGVRLVLASLTFLQTSHLIVSSLISMSFLCAGLLDPAEYQRARTEVREQFSEIAEQIQKLGTKEGLPYDDILKTFEGPPQ